MMRDWIFFCGLSLLGCGWSFAAQPGSLADVPSPDVEVQKAGFVVPEGYEVSLWAAEPLLQKPVQMNWDAQGRLWVVSSTTYPHIEVGAAAEDQVVVLEDTNGDGVADKSTVFADQLHIPTAVVPGDGGVYVANSTELLFLKDHNGDGRADERRVMLSGFGTEDTHHLLHTLRFGPEGLLHFAQSIYIHSHIETPYGIRRLMGGGVWEFRPETRRLEVISKGLINPWGYEYDRWGQSFATDGAGSEGLNFIFPGAVYATSPGAVRILRGMSPGQPKHCGLEVIEDDYWPADWQGSWVTCDFRGNRINRFQLERVGSGYVAKQMPDVLASTHRAFRPIDVRVGPDGALYVADWYNPIIQHGEVDFRDPRRDHVHGRIWRIGVKGAPKRELTPVVGRPVPELLELLKSGRRWDRHFAKQELRVRGAVEVLPAWDTWVAGLNETEVEADRHALLEAAWVREGINSFSIKLWRRLFAVEDPRVRAAALRILSHRWQEMKEVRGVLEQGLKDADMQVRLWAVAVCGLVGTAEMTELATLVLEQPMDEALDFALEQVCRERAEEWLPLFLDEKLSFGNAADRRVYALRASGRAEALPALLDELKAGRVPENQLAAVLDAAGKMLTGETLTVLAERVGDEEMKPHRVAMLEAMVKAAETRKVVAVGGQPWLEAWLEAGDEAVVRLAARLVGLWKVEPLRERLAAWLVDGSMSLAAREAAVDGLARLGGAASRDLFDASIGAAGEDRVSVGLMIDGLTRVAPQLAAKRAAEFLASAKSAEETAAVMAVMLRDKRLPALLAKELEEKTVAEAVATEAIRMITTRAADEALVAAFKKAGGVRQMDRALSAEEMQALVARVAAEGDAARGEVVYRRQQLLCISCHAIGDAGGVLGPNLVSIGASAPVDYLIESLLDPSAKIKEGYHMVVVNTKGGQVFSGGLVKDGDTELVIRDPSNNLQSVPKAEVASQIMSPVSMMPAGLTASLREDEFVDLVAFLSALGQEGDYKISPRKFVRNWRALGEMEPQLVDQVRHLGLPSLHDSSMNLPWVPLTSLVSGEIPLAEIPVAQRMYPWHPRVVRMALKAAEAGEVELGLSATEGIVMVVGDQILQEVASTQKIRVAQGETSVTILITRAAGDLSGLGVELLSGAVEVLP